MKITILSVTLIIGMYLTSFAQNVTLSESELMNILCQQWEIKYAMMNGMKIGQMPGATDFDIKFIDDGTYDLIQDDGKDESGIWTYDAEKKYVELKIKERITSRIKFIDKTNLILTLVSGENDSPGLQNVEVHFKPI